MKINVSMPIVIAFILTVCLAIGISFCNKRTENQNRMILKTGKTIQTWAIFDREAIGIGSFGTYYYFFNKKGKRIEFKVRKYYKLLTVGDTVWIRYSVKDNEIAEILNPNYMIKHHSWRDL